ncbi:DinB family protein [Cellulomonas sp. C5510]|nr:DinB family protein [Cellulomonas sp. C5510]
MTGRRSPARRGGDLLGHVAQQVARLAVPAVFSEPSPTFDRVLAVRAERQAMVRDHLASVTPADLTGVRPNPWGPDHLETVLSCLHTILDEEWSHLRFALRDLDALAARPTDADPA